MKLLEHPARAVTFAFGAATAAGTVLLWLPPSAAGEGSSFLTALFTATSALSLTGLAVVDTGSHWSVFGQVVIMVLMQIGGLGIMTATSLLGLVVARRLGLRNRLWVQAEAASSDLGTIRRLLWGVLRISLTIEALCWLALTMRLWLGYGTGFGKSVWYGLFHAVAAYNNGGLALWPDSLARFGSDVLILAPIALAFSLGALGYPVLLEILRPNHPTMRWSVHSKLTVITFAIVVGIGTLLVVVTEFTNDRSIGVHGGVAGRLAAGVFSGLTAGSAGFSVIDYSVVDPATRLVTDVLTFIGGGSAGTAGGIKLTTLAVLVLAVAAEVRGDRDAQAFGRRMSAALVRQALSVLLLSGAAVVGGTVLLLAMTDVGLDDALFEVTSAFSSGGLSTGITAGLPAPAKYLLVVLMFVGRLGPITVATSLALRSNQRLSRLPEARPLVG